MAIKSLWLSCMAVHGVVAIQQVGRYFSTSSYRTPSLNLPVSHEIPDKISLISTQSIRYQNSTLGIPLSNFAPNLTTTELISNNAGNVSSAATGDQANIMSSTTGK